MPTYTYKCSDCGYQFDIHQSFSDEPLSQCPQCEGALHKRYGSVGVTFKGSGFYHNDSRASLKKTPSSAPKKATAKSAA